MNYVLIDAGLALIALVVGFFSALWYFGHTSDSSSAGQERSEEAARKAKEANDSERANMAALQMRDLAQNVASDVGAHNTLVSDISNQLGTLESGAADSGAVVAEAVTKVLTANGKLQNQLANAEQKIQSQAAEIQAQQSDARTDTLTKLANRRAFDDAMEKNLASFKADRRPFSLLIFDVDHFKHFNDTHGHQAGDEVLRSVGTTLTKTVKTTDIPCRYGGEEFALIMPATKIDSARLAAERVRKAIEAMVVKFEDKTLRVTASIGVAGVTTGEDTTKLVRRSDDAVYAAKKAGRNRTFWHNEHECLPIDAEATQPNVAAPESFNGSSPDNKPNQPSSLDTLPSRTDFSGELQRRVAESHRFGASLSVLFLRVADFANLEKEYGNAVGMLLLESVAQFIRGTLRDMDLLGRLDPGDFVVMLPGSSEKEAQMVGDRVRSAISNCVIPLGDKKLRLKILKGVTDVYPDDDADKMIERAQQLIDQPRLEPVTS